MRVKSCMTKRQFLTLLATIIGSGIVLLDGTVVNLALPALAKDMGAGFSDLQWIIDGYLLSLSSLILLGGSLGDIFGRKRVYLIGLAGFGVASILCGLAPTPLMLIIMRAAQGVFGALLVPGGLAIINTNFNFEQRGAAIGRWAAWSGAAVAIGPPIGGYLVDNFSWRWIFFINAPLVLACLYLALPNIKESRDLDPRRIDYTGGLPAAASLAGITYGLIQGPTASWNITTTLPLASGVLLFSLFLAVKARKQDPMLNLRLFSSHNFTGANIATFAMYGGLNGFFFALIIHLQTKVGYSGTMAGMSLLPVTLLLLTLSGRMGKLAGRYGARYFMTCGPVLAAAGMMYLLDLTAGSSYWGHILPGVLLFGFGLSLTVAPLTITVMSSVARSDSGIASGINNAIARAAGLIIIASLGIFGAGGSYRFAILLSSALAVTAGVISYLLVRNPAAEDRATDRVSH